MLQTPAAGLFQALTRVSSSWGSWGVAPASAAVGAQLHETLNRTTLQSPVTPHSESKGDSDGSRQLVGGILLQCNTLGLLVENILGG